MSLLRSTFFWVLALGLALFVLFRIRRGRQPRLQGKWSPGLLRKVAVILVFLQGCVDGFEVNNTTGSPSQPASTSAPSQPVTSLASLPTSRLSLEFPIKDDVALRTNFLMQSKNSSWQRLKRFLLQVESNTNTLPWEDARKLASSLSGSLLVGSPSFSPLLVEHLTRKEGKQKDSLAQLLALLDAAEVFPVYDAWFGSYLWRQARESLMAGSWKDPNSLEQLVTLLGRLERHLRVWHSLAQAQREVGPVEFTAWRSKAAPTKGWTGITVPKGLREAARDLFPATEAGSWHSQAVLNLKVKEAPTALLLYRQGEAISLAEGEVFTFRRLDVLLAPEALTLEHTSLGQFSVPAGTAILPWNLGDFLSKETRSKLKGRVEAANQGDASALQEVEVVLAASQGLIREELAARPEASGAPALRGLLTLFDE